MAEMDNSDVELESPMPLAELFLTADGMRLFKIRRTLMQMLRDRGYDVSDEELCQTREQFREAFSPSPVRETLKFHFPKLSNGEDRILVIFAEQSEKAQVGVATIKECADAMQASRARRAILVVDKCLSAVAKRAISQMDKGYSVEVFQESELLVNIMDSVFVPKHQILLPEEEKAVLEKYAIADRKEQLLPKLPRTDPVARYLGLEKGQVIKIVRRGNSAAYDPKAKHETVNYRVVV